MHRLEVLVATMHQTDFSKIVEMNIDSDAFFANQSEVYAYDETYMNGHQMRMLTTPERGVGKNRNKALLYAEGDILLFSDDDMVYNDGYAEEILKAYQEIPDADVIIFGCDLEKEGMIIGRVANETKRLRIHNAMKYGTSCVSVRRERLEKANIWFSVLFGGGCEFSAGEDSLFLMDCFKKKLRIYSHQYVLGRSKCDVSTWFSGYHEKYFHDKGVWIGAALPVVSGYVFMLHLAFRTRKMSDISFWKRVSCMRSGMKTWKRKAGISNENE